MRRLLRQAAFVHICNEENSVVSEMYRRLTGRGKAHNEALVACSRKLLTVVWSVLRNRRPYTSDTELLAKSNRMAEELLEEESDE